MHLLLFDIDGTLVRVNRAGRRAVQTALEDLVGTDLSTDGASFSGKTDPQILSEVLAANGIEASDALVSDALEVYAEAAAPVLSSSTVTALPGTQPLLTALADRDDVQLALLTGNIEAMAYRKLEAVSMAQYFSFGAFGSDHADRNRLPEVALRRARRDTGRAFAASETVIIGDTIHDIECGQTAGARCVGVCSGSDDRAALSRAGADLLFEDLRDRDAFCRAVLHDRPSQRPHGSG